jgi:hypothetical protein
MFARQSFHLQHFENGFIEYDGHLEIDSPLLNVVLRDQPHISAVNSVTGEPDRQSK